jgi:hypothetical protein
MSIRSRQIPDAMTMTDAGDERVTADSATTPLVFRCLVAVSLGETDPFADDRSRERFESAYDRATTRSERDALRRALETESDPEQIRSVLDAVRAALVRADVSVVLDHQVPFSFSPADAGLYTFLVEESESAARNVPVPSEFETDVNAGLDDGLGGSFDEAAERFERALERAEDGQPFVPRVLAGWARLRCGDLDQVRDHVGALYRSDPEATSPRVLGIAASHPETERFFDGALAARLFVRHTVSYPGESSVSASIGLHSADGTTEWVSLEGACAFPKLAEDVTLRLRFDGTFEAFPRVHGYTVGFGVVDRKRAVVTDVLERRCTGPVTAASTERLRLR